MEELLDFLSVLLICAIVLMGIVAIFNKHNNSAIERECVFQGYMGMVRWDKRAYCIRYNSDLVAEIAPLDE